MIDPFDAEFLSQELRDSWKKIEELEKRIKREAEERLKAETSDLLKKYFSIPGGNK